MNVNQFVNRIVSMANVFRQISVYVMRATETSRHMNVNHTASPNVKMPLVTARITVLVSLAIDSQTDHSLNVNQSVNLIVRTVIVFRQTSAYAKVVTGISQPLQVFSVNRYVNQNVKMAIASVQTNVNVEMVIKLRMKRWTTNASPFVAQSAANTANAFNQMCVRVTMAMKKPTARIFVA